jgi:hypothetical protein
LQPGEQAADHYRMGAGGDGFGHVSRVANPSVGNDRHIRLLGGPGGIINCGNLRDADAGNHPRGANRAGTDAHLDGIRPGGDQVRAALGRGDVARHDVDVPTLLDVSDRLDDVGRMAVGTIDHQHIDVFGDHALDAFVLVNADSRPHP